MSQFTAIALNRVIHENPTKGIEILQRLSKEAAARGRKTEASRFRQEARDVKQMMAA